MSAEFYTTTVLWNSDPDRVTGSNHKTKSCVKKNRNLIKYDDTSTSRSKIPQSSPVCVESYCNPRLDRKPELTDESDLSSISR